MTAAGVLLFILGMFIGRVFGHPLPRVFNTADYIAVGCINFGAAMVIAGVVKLLWEVMP